MLLQDQIGWADLDTDWLDFMKAISVDTIHLETREYASDEGHELNLNEGRVPTELFEQAREKIEAKGMKLNNVFYSCPRAIPLGLEGADEGVEIWCRLLESLKQAGIPSLGWNYKPMGNFRTPRTIGRGGAGYSTFDYDLFMQHRPELYSPEVTAEEMWERMESFMRAVIPVAEKTGVTMALHPDDPPVPEPLGGVAQVCMTELLGQGVYDFIAEMSAKNKVQWVHFRNVRGQLPHFEEVFMDEGDIDMKRAMEVYRDNGFNGPFMMDHTPQFQGGDSARYGKAYANGYIRRLIQEVYG